MDLVTGAVGNLAPKLFELLQGEYKLQKGVRNQVELISKELESISAALHKVGKVPPDQLDEQVRIWARQVREASYDMEDVLDTFLVRVEGDDKPTGDHSRLKHAMKKIRALFSKGKARHDIAGIIEDIKEQLEEVTKRRDKYRIEEVVPKPEGETSIDPRLSALYTEASKLIGIDGPKEALIEMLSIGKDDTSGEKKIVSVFGSGGLGKTTLAKAAYDQVKLQFDCCAFVQVGQNPVPKKVLKEMLVMLIDEETKKNNIAYDKRRNYNGADPMGLEAEDLISEQCNFLQGKRYRKYTGADLMGLEAHDLIREIREFLQGKRYLIVVDDLWDRETWENIKLAFVDSNRGSRIVATSRNSQISEKIGDEVYRINKLSDQNSRRLFFARISDKRGDKYPDIGNLDEISDKIIKKCDGVPLVIIAVACMLATKPRNEWPDVYKSIGFGHDGDNIEAINMKKILSFSYYDLPCKIKTCMLYLSVFPEDHYVHKNMLIRRWIAEGLVPTKEGEGLFETGEGYFHELVNRGLILPSDDGGFVDGCRVHDFVLDLIRELSREQNFVITVAGSEQEQSLPLPAGGKVRRLALQKISDTIIKGCLPIKFDEEQMGVARSFSAIYSDMLPAVSRLKHLRVLALEYCRVEEGYLDHIGKLLHLRYLGLTGTPVGKLPEGVGNLKFLQTLTLHGTGIRELPQSLEQRTELMCLRADEMTIVPNWIGKLTSLAELEMYPGASASVAERFVKELSKLRRLRVVKTKIHLPDQGQVRELLESLSKLREIEIMEMSCHSSAYTKVMDEGVLLDFKKNNLRVLILDAFKFPRLPAWINPESLPKLYRLKLCISRLEDQDMETLGRFPNLHILDLAMVEGAIWEEDGDDRITCGEGGFQNLVAFQFIPFGGMIKFSPGAMPRLRYLSFAIGLAFDRLGKLILDYGLGNLGSLEQAQALLICEDCFPAEVEAVEAAVRRQILGIRPKNNPPTLSMTRYQVDTTGMKDAERIERLVQTHRCARLWQRHRNQSLPFTELISEMDKMVIDWSRSGTCYTISMEKVDRILEECMDKLEIAIFFNGRILRGAGFKDPGILWVQFTSKDEENRQLILQDRDVHETMQHIAALRRGIEVLTTAEYQRLAAMWEQVQKHHSLLVQGKKLVLRLMEQSQLHNRLYISFETTELLPIDGMKLQVVRFMNQWYDNTELAFHGRVLRLSELSAEDHPEEIDGFWKKYIAKYQELVQFEADRDMDQLREHIAALEGALGILTAEYPRLAKMWEELQAAQDGLLRAIMREEELGKRLNEQLRLYHPLVSPYTSQGLVDNKLLALDANKVRRYFYQSWDTLELAVHGRILWRDELGDEDHPDYFSQGMVRVSDQLKAAFQPFGPDRDVHQVEENIAAREAVLEKLTVEYPRLAAMFEALKAELCLPAAEDEGTDTTK